jgi:menaquinone-dependent protoporphyrinogen oxidase
MSRTVLVAYASKMGSTAEIAAAVGDELRRCGHQVDVRDVAEVSSVAGYDAVIVGSSLYLWHWRPQAVQFLRRFADELCDRQVWLFHSGALGKDKDAPQELPAAVAALVRRIGGHTAVTFPGRLELKTAKGFMARRMARGEEAGDYRDWEQISRWAQQVGEAIESAGIGTPTR